MDGWMDSQMVGREMDLYVDKHIVHMLNKWIIFSRGGMFPYDFTDPSHRSLMD